MIHAIFVGVAVYATQKMFHFLATAPNDSLNERMRQIRDRVFECRQLVKDRVSDRSWFIMTNVMADNAWVAATLLTYLAGGRAFESVEMGINSITALAGFCSLSCLVRFAAVKTFPSLERFVGTGNV